MPISIKAAHRQIEPISNVYVQTSPSQCVVTANQLQRKLSSLQYNVIWMKRMWITRHWGTLGAGYRSRYPVKRGSFLNSVHPCHVIVRGWVCLNEKTLVNVTWTYPGCISTCSDGGSTLSWIIHPSFVLKDLWSLLHLISVLCVFFTQR